MADGIERRVARLEDQYDTLNKHLTDILISVKTNGQKNEDFINSMNRYVNKHEEIHKELIKKDEQHDKEVEKMNRLIFGAYVVAAVLGFVVSPVGQRVFTLLFS